MSYQDLKLEVTKDIVVKMLDEKIISATTNNTAAERNQSYVTEICKAIKAVYQTVDELVKP